MGSEIILASGFTLTDNQPVCVDASFQNPSDLPLLSAAAKDDRGSFFAIDYSDGSYTEIIHSRPNAIRGNHVHKKSTEAFIVLTGEIDMYLLCKCPTKHLLTKTMKPGMSVVVYPGIAHAIYSRTNSECVAILTKNTYDDRDKVSLISHL